MLVEPQTKESIDSKAEVVSKAYVVVAGKGKNEYIVIPENKELTDFTVILNDRDTYKTEFVTIDDESCECTFYEKNVLDPESDNERCCHINAGYEVREHILTEELNVGV